MARKLPGRTDKAIKNHFMRSFDKTTDFKDRKHSKKRGKCTLDLSTI